MPRSRKTPDEKRLKLKYLKSHPLQSIYYDETTAADDAALAADLKNNGQRDPIVVMPTKNAAGLPAYTVLDGHRRAKLLADHGETEVDVLVRDDLADADAATIEAEFLKFNAIRRQLHPIDQARIALRLFEIEKNRSPGELWPREEGEARDRIGAAIGMSGRNLSRYFRLLLTPLEVQRAVRDGKLPLVQGEKVEGLSKTQQTEIAVRIRAGETAKHVVSDFVKSNNGRHRNPNDALVSFARSLERGLNDLEGRVDVVGLKVLKEFKSTLEAGLNLIKRLLKQSDK